MEIKKILVTGSEGYIGTTLIKKLIENKYDVVGLDTCYFKKNRETLNYKLINEDIRNVDSLDLREFDAIIHLAALSNDPLGELNSDLTSEINFKSTVNLAKKAKNSGVKKFLFSSSCSIYGTAKSSFVNEKSRVNPLTEYAKSKIRSERQLIKLSDDYFRVYLLRNSTVYGYSQNFRNDLVVNDLTLNAFISGEMKIISDGTPWRPLIDIRDLSDIFISFLKDKRKISPAPINIGFKENNLQVKEIVEKISKVFPHIKSTYLSISPSDKRSYKVDFSKFNKLFPKIKQKWPIEKSALDMVENFKVIRIKDTSKFNRLKSLRTLIYNHKLDKNLYWNI